MFPPLHRWIVGATLALVTGHTVNAQSTSVSYYFGTLAGQASAGTKDGTGGAAQFNGPQGVMVDANGNLFVADTGNRTVRKITAAGVVSTLAGKAGVTGSMDGSATAARFSLPVGVAVDANGALFVGDGRLIRRIGTDGAVRTFAGSDVDVTSAVRDGTGADARFQWIEGLAIDRDGILYVTEAWNNTVRQVSPAAVVTTYAGGGSVEGGDGTGGAANFLDPSGIAVDAAGVVYVADLAHSTIRRIGPGGVVTTVAGRSGTTGHADGTGTAATFNYPDGIAVDGTGRLVVADSGNGSIRAVSTAGAVTTLVAMSGSPFSRPAGLAVDAAGNAYVADSVANVIRKVTPTGVVSLVAGVSPAESAGSTDGAGSSARFNDPRAITVTRQGVSYVADTGNHVIRRITRDGVVTTLAGTAGQPGYVDGTGAAARFASPFALAVDDRTGALYVLDNGNTVRKVTTEGLVTTVAGSSTSAREMRDGQGAAASFSGLTSIGVAPDGTVWVADYGREALARLRRVSADGTVTTDLRASLQPHSLLTALAFDASGTLYACDKVYSAIVRLTPAGASDRIAAKDFDAAGVAVDATGTLFISETGAGRGYVRVGRLNLDGTVTVLGGRAVTRAGHQDGIGEDASFGTIYGLAVDGSGVLYLACSDNTIRRGGVAAAPVISSQPRDLTVATGAAAEFSVAVEAVPTPQYQWYLNGTAIAEATAATYNAGPAAQAKSGDYTVTVSNALGSVTSNKAKLTVTMSPPPPSGGSGSGGGGGGAPSVWFLALLATLTAVRRRRGSGG